MIVRFREANWSVRIKYPCWQPFLNRPATDLWVFPQWTYFTSHKSATEDTGPDLRPRADPHRKECRNPSPEIRCGFPESASGVATATVSTARL